MKNLLLKLKILFIILTVISTLSCSSNKKTIKADLSFRSISFTSAYGAEPRKIEEYVNEAKEYVRKYESTRDELIVGHYELSKHILKLDKLNLLEKPHIYLHLGADSIIEVHVEPKEYEKIKMFRRTDLYKENSKVVLELVIEEKDKGIFYSDKIISVNKVPGKTKSDLKPIDRL